MFHRSIRPACLLLCICFPWPALEAAPEDWPGWRSPRGDGTSLEKNVPVRWDGATGENIAWKVEVPGEGHASPIVVGDRVFLVTCLEERGDRVLLCLDRRTGGGPRRSGPGPLGPGGSLRGRTEP